jgi:hypothetical protein
VPDKEFRHSITVKSSLWVPWQALKFPSPLPHQILAEHVLKIFLFRNIFTFTNSWKFFILAHQQISYRSTVQKDTLVWSVVEIKCLFTNGLILYFSNIRTAASWDVTPHSLLTCINVYLDTCWLFLHLETYPHTSVYSQTSVNNVTRIQDITYLKTVFFIITSGRNSNLIWILIYLRQYLRPNSAHLFKKYSSPFPYTVWQILTLLALIPPLSNMRYISRHIPSSAFCKTAHHSLCVDGGVSLAALMCTVSYKGRMRTRDESVILETCEQQVTSTKCPSFCMTTSCLTNLRVLVP